jgi:hypothetical protein
MASETYGADWVINADADEFWWPHAASLPEALRDVPTTVGRLTVDRTNFLPVPQKDGPFFERMTVRERSSRNALGQPLPPKMCHRTCATVVVEQGNHAVSSPALGEEVMPAGITILHFPLRTYQQFENKIVKGGAAYARNRELPVHIGATWRELYLLYQAGQLRAHYDAQVLTSDRLDAGLRDGSLIEDRRLRDFLSARLGNTAAIHLPDLERPR